MHCWEKIDWTTKKNQHENLLDMNDTSLSIIQRNAKYKCTCIYLPNLWCNLMVTSRAFSITTSGMYEKWTGSLLKCWPPILKKTFACTKTCKTKKYYEIKSVRKCIKNNWKVFWRKKNWISEIRSKIVDLCEYVWWAEWIQ
jgi:hypothetical protein